MALLYNQITADMARKIQLVVTDVDETLTSNDGSFSSSVREAMRLLKDQGIIVGLISGRNMVSLMSCVREFGIDGPVIAENGGQVKLSPDGATLNFSRQEIPAKALSRLKNKFGTAIYESELNCERVTDLIIGCTDISIEELQRCLDDTDIIETGNTYKNRDILHLIEKGVNKGEALASILKELGQGEINEENTLVIGDGPNDLSMFHLFPFSLLVSNPRHAEKYRRTLQFAARFSVSTPGGDGFAEAVNYLINIRLEEVQEYKLLT